MYVFTLLVRLFLVSTMPIDLSFPNGGFVLYKHRMVNQYTFTASFIKIIPTDLNGFLWILTVLFHRHSQPPCWAPSTRPTKNCPSLSAVTGRLRSSLIANSVHHHRTSSTPTNLNLNCCEETLSLPASSHKSQLLLHILLIYDFSLRCKSVESAYTHIHRTAPIFGDLSVRRRPLIHNNPPLPGSELEFEVGWMWGQMGHGMGARVNATNHLPPGRWCLVRFVEFRFINRLNTLKQSGEGIAPFCTTPPPGAHTFRRLGQRGRERERVYVCVCERASQRYLGPIPMDTAIFCPVSAAEVLIAKAFGGIVRQGG